MLTSLTQVERNRGAGFSRCRPLQDAERHWLANRRKTLAAAPAKEFGEKLGKAFMEPKQFVRITYTGLLRHP
jgi:hypothetical protein